MKRQRGRRGRRFVRCGGQPMAGTFASLFDKISKCLSEKDQVDSLSSNFRWLSTDDERIRFVLETEVIGGILDQRSYCRENKNRKSQTASESLRLQGNSLFQKKLFTSALEKYTESIFNSECRPGNAQCLAMALANRSAVHFQMSEFGDALTDAENALCYDYPEKLKYKLLERIGKCHLKENRLQLAKIYFKDAILALAKAELSVDNRNKLALECYKFEKMCLNVERKEEKCNFNGKESIPENEKADSNTIYPCATSAFSIAYDASHGRHALATREINAGELIVFEKPYASVLFAENRLTHCHNCLKRCNTLIGCPSCSFIGFCSTTCKNLAIDSYHGLECKFLSLIHDADIKLGQLALRMVVKAGFHYLMQFSNNTKIGNDGLNSDGIYDSLDYAAVHSLIGHTDSRPLSDLFRRAVMAVFLLKFVENEAFFTTDSKSVFQKKVCVGAHILRQLQMLPCNAHEVSELQIDKSSVADSELKEIGSAIYATLSLLNHSCDPSVVRHSYGNSCALRAIKQIPKGGMIIDNYGALYAVNGFAERQSLVSSQYFFSCRCVACTENWPLYNMLPKQLPAFRCPACKTSIQNEAQSRSSKIHCDRCQMVLSVSVAEFDSSRGKFSEAMDAILNGGNPKEYLPTLLKHLQLMCEIIKLPWQEFNNCQEIVKQCLSMLANHHYF